MRACSVRGAAKLWRVTCWRPVCVARVCQACASGPTPMAFF
jgi:hypothetical protein